MKRILILGTIISGFLGMWSCNQPVSNQDAKMPVVTVKTTLVKSGDIENYLRFNGKTVYLKKNTIVSPISGYVTKVNKKFGDNVNKNDVLFEIQTKEGRALENTNAAKAGMGIVQVLASNGGIINELMITDPGAYIVEGGALCTIVENEDMIVKVNVPFQYNALIKPGTKCTIFLSDNTSFDGNINRILPMVDEANQTQEVLITANAGRPLPENLNLIVQFVKERHPHSLLVNKSAVMTNETQDEFWVMRIENGNLAVEVPIKKGIENDSIVEILAAGLSESDVVISEGAYSLPDSTIVSISK